MQKNTNVWLLAGAIAAACFFNNALAADLEPQSKVQSFLDASKATDSAQSRRPESIIQDAPSLSPQQSRKRLQLLANGGPWLNNQGMSENSRQLIRAIQNAAHHGLNPESYGLAKILRTVKSLNISDSASIRTSSFQQPATKRSNEQLRNDLSAQMDQSFVQLATHLGQGVVDPRATQRMLFRDAPQIDTAALLDSIWSRQASVSVALKVVTPASADYQRLTTHMRNLLTERAAGMVRPTLRQPVTLSVSMSHKDVRTIKQRLVETGELALNTRITPLFDNPLAIALQQFQKRHGLLPDGHVGRKTREALNRSIDDEIQAVALSLERWRWMPRELGQKHLFINIPDYRVEFRDGQEIKMSMISVMGAEDHVTPTFSRDMSYMEFNPTWTVPESIANSELIPLEMQNPGYLVSRQFEFLQRVNNHIVVIAPESVTAADYQTKPFPYTLRQRGGAINALGRLKFMMPNPYAIYLHDTPEKQHFSFNERAYSHGCIRLSDPDALATLLMKEDGYNADEIRQALSDPETHRVRLRTHIPTHLTYMTTWLDADGDLQQRSDVYRYDAALLIALQTSDTLLSILNQPVAAL